MKMNGKCQHGVPFERACESCDAPDLRRQLADTQQKLTDSQENYRLMADSRQDALRERDEARAEVDRMKADDAMIQLIKGDWNQVVSLVEPYPGDFTPTKLEGIIAKLNRVGEILCAGGEDVEEWARKVMGNTASLEQAHADLQEEFNTESDLLDSIRQATQSVLGNDLLAKVEGLVKVWKKLPITADGVRVVPGEDNVWWAKVIAKSLGVGCGGGAVAWTFENGVERQVRVNECYSSQVAAMSQGLCQRCGGSGEEWVDDATDVTGAMAEVVQGKPPCRECKGTGKVKASPSPTPNPASPTKALGATSAASIVKELREAGGKGWDSIEVPPPSRAEVATGEGAATRRSERVTVDDDPMEERVAQVKFFRERWADKTEQAMVLLCNAEPDRSLPPEQAKDWLYSRQAWLDAYHDSIPTPSADAAPAPSGAEAAQVPTPTQPPLNWWKQDRCRCGHTREEHAMVMSHKECVHSDDGKTFCPCDEYNPSPQSPQPQPSAPVPTLNRCKCGGEGQFFTDDGGELWTVVCGGKCGIRIGNDENEGRFAEQADAAIAWNLANPAPLDASEAPAGDKGETK